MPRILRSVFPILTIAILFSVASCSNSTDNTAVTPEDPNAPDTTIIRTAFYPDSLVQFLYYSLDADSVVDPIYADTDLWDIKFEHINVNRVLETFDKQVDVLLNSSSINPAGKTLGMVVNQPFDQVKQVPDDNQLRSDSSNFSSRIFNMDGISTKSLVSYVSQNHTLLPKAEKTVIIRTQSGNYVKFQLINLYKGVPANPTDAYDIGYYTFRYTRNDGKRLK